MKLTRLALAVAMCALVGIGVFRLYSGDKKPTLSKQLPDHSVTIIPARILKPSGPPKGFVIYFSDQGGWDDDADHIAHRLARSGYAVAGIDTSVFLAQLSEGKAACIHPVQPLMAVARKAQRDFGWSSYVSPTLAGHGLGGTVVYATLAQAVPGIFRAGISYDYGGFIPGNKPWCAANGYQANHVTNPHNGWRPGATKQLPTPWRLIVDGPIAQPLTKVLSVTPNTRKIRATNEEQAIETIMSSLMPAQTTPQLPQPSPSFSKTPESLPA